MDRRFIRFLGVLALGLLAVSCGGGGGGGASNTVPTPAAYTCSSGGSNIASLVTAGSGSNAAGVLSCTQGLAALQVPTSGNCAPVIVDFGPCAYGVIPGSPTGTAATVFQVGTANVPFVAVTICNPGTNVCQTIDHILVDTGSTGLRVMSSVLSPSISLPAVNVGATPLIECVQFADGYSWGSIRMADVRIAGESAPGIPVQVIGDSTGLTVPSGCTGTSPSPVLVPLNDVISFGANGVLGVGLFNQDCGAYCVTNSGSTFYYTCAVVTACAGSTASLAQQVTNPVFAFATDNNGVMLQLPAVPAGGGSLNPTGALFFGINTQANNNAASNTSLNAYLASGGGTFYTTLVGVTGGYTASGSYSNSFIDSGSNGIYMPGTTIPVDPTYGWFGGTLTSVNVTATQQGTDSSGTLAAGHINTVVFDVTNDLTLFGVDNGNDSAFNGLAGPSTTGTVTIGGVDWGLPFFFGRPIFVGMEGKTIAINGPASVGPFWAY